MIKSKKHLTAIERVTNDKLDRRPFIRLDKNEGCTTYGEEFWAEAHSLLRPEFLSSYPQPYRLQEKLAQYLDVSEERLYVGAGSDAVIKAAFEIFIEPGDAVVMPLPNYAMYSVYAQIFQAELRAVEYSADYTVPLDELLGRIDAAVKMVVISNPNSPVGTLFSRDEIICICHRAAEAQAVVLLDEAYYPFSEMTMLAELPSCPNLIVTRTFSKAFGLAALRLGYAVASEEIIALYKKVRPMYEINGFAEALGCLALEHFDETSMLASFTEAKQSLLAALDRLGCTYIDTRANFIHVHTPKNQERLLEHMATHNILMKRSGGGVLADYVRISILSVDGIRACCAALEDFMHGA